MQSAECRVQSAWCRMQGRARGAELDCHCCTSLSRQLNTCSLQVNSSESIANICVHFRLLRLLVATGKLQADHLGPRQATWQSQGQEWWQSQWWWQSQEEQDRSGQAKADSIVPCRSHPPPFQRDRRAARANSWGREAGGSRPPSRRHHQQGRPQPAQPKVLQPTTTSHTTIQ